MNNKEYIDVLFTLGKLIYNEKLGAQLDIIYECGVDIGFLLRKFNSDKDIESIIQVIAILLVVYKDDKKEQESILELLGKYVDNKRNMDVVLDKIMTRALRLDNKASIKKELCELK